MKAATTTEPRARTGSSESLKPLVAFLGVYTLFFFWLAYRRYSLFTNDSADGSLFVNTFWTTLHGRFFWNYILGMPYFGDHADFIMIPMVPIYWLAPYPSTLLLVQSVLIAAAGIPLYLIARKALDDRAAALLVTAAFLFFPTVASQHVNQIHDTQFVIVFVLYAFYFFMIERFGLFVLFLFLSCLGKENVPLTLLMFGVYAALQRRHWKWIVTPLLLSGGTLLLCFKVIMPYFRGQHLYRSFAYFGALGDTPLQVVQNIVKDPGVLFSILSAPANMFYLIELVQPVGWILPFLSLPVIFILPDLAVNLLADNTSLKVIRWHYNMMVGAFLFVGAIFSVKKLCAWLSRRYGPARYAAGFGVLLLCLSVAHWTLWFDVNDYRQPPQYESLREALTLVPPGASVLVPQTMLMAVADRWNFNTIQDWINYRKRPDKVFGYKYVIIDGNERRPPWNVPVEVIRAFANNRDYELIFNQENVLVFRRIGEDTIAGAPPEAPSS